MRCVFNLRTKKLNLDALQQVFETYYKTANALIYESLEIL